MRSVQVMAALSDPLHDLIRASRRDRPWLPAAFVLAAGVHLAAAWLLSQRLAHPAALPPVTSELFDIQLPEPEPEPAPAAQAEPEPAPTPLPPAAKLKQREPTPAKDTPPAALAQAAAVVTRQETPDEPVDLTGFVTGNAATYAGGTTASAGTSNKPGHREVGAVGPATSTGALAGGSSVDRSQPPTVVGELDWHCPFPSEADSDRIDDAVATIRVAIDASARLTRVDVLEDPSHGFGRAAQSCARDKVWRAARDHDGKSVAGSVTVRVRFVR